MCKCANEYMVLIKLIKPIKLIKLIKPIKLIKLIKPTNSLN